MKYATFIALIALSFFMATNTSADISTKETAAKDVHSIDIVILWNADAFPPPDAGQFAAFLGTLKKSDRIAVSMLDEKTTVVLPMQSFSQGGGLTVTAGNAIEYAPFVQGFKRRRPRQRRVFRRYNWPNVEDVGKQAWQKRGPRLLAALQGR